MSLQTPSHNFSVLDKNVSLSSGSLKSLEYHCFGKVAARSKQGGLQQEHCHRANDLQTIPSSVPSMLISADSTELGGPMDLTRDKGVS